MAQDITPSDKKNIVILGGSYAGVSTAHYVLKHAVPKLPDTASYQVILVSVASQILCRPACPRALISDDMFPQEKLFVDAAKSFEQYPEGAFRFVQGTVTELEHTKRSVSILLSTGGSEKIDFYSLVIATGASTHSPLFSPSQGETTLKSNWAVLREALPNAKSIVILGGGPTGVETAGELGDYLNGRAGWFASKLVNPKVSITVITSAPQILPLLRPAIAKKGEDFLARVGVSVIKNTKVKSVTPDGVGRTEIAAKSTLTLEDGTTLNADLFIPATGVTPNSGFVDKSLLNAEGRVEVNVSTLRVDKAGPRIYAVGDVSSYCVKPSIHNLLEAIPVLGANIKRDLLLAAGPEDVSVKEDRVFKEDMRETQLVVIGKSMGVGSVMGYQLPSFLVWAIKGRDYWLWAAGPLWSGKHWAKES